jgi:hypothetical protein
MLGACSMVLRLMGAGIEVGWSGLKGLVIGAAPLGWEVVYSWATFAVLRALVALMGDFGLVFICEPLDFLL